MGRPNPVPACIVSTLTGKYLSEDALATPKGKGGLVPQVLQKSGIECQTL